MEPKFTNQQIDHHVESVHVLVQPPIDVKADRLHLQEFYNRVSEDQPRLFDSLAQQPNSFEIKKQLVIPRKGRVEVVTFHVTPKGPVLLFPHRLPFMQDDVPWSNNKLNCDVVRCLETLQACHATWKYLQVKKRRELIFSTQSQHSSQIIHKRFALGVPEAAQEVGVRWADGNDLYDRKIVLSAAERKVVVQENVGGVQYQREAPEIEYGVQVVLEVSNRKLAPLTSDAIQIVLDHADSYYKDTLLNILRGGPE